MEAKPPKFTLYKYHSSQGIIMENTNKAYVYRSFISIIFPFPAFWFILQRKNVSILYKYHISQKWNLEWYSKYNYVSILYKYHISQAQPQAMPVQAQPCRSFISIIFPYLSMLYINK